MTDTWLKEPNGEWIMRFHIDPESWSKYPWYFLDRGLPIQGESPLLKSRKRLTRTDALQIWKELRKEGWKKIDAQW